MPLYFENICLGSNLPVTIILHKGQKIFNLSQRMVNMVFSNQVAIFLPSTPDQ